MPGLARLGYPIAEIDADGHCTIGKPPGTGGLIDGHTVKEQLLYEVHDPAAYLTPDVVADITEARVIDLGGDRVRLEGVRGHPRTATLKVNVCHGHRLAGRGRDLVRRRARRGPRAARRRRAARAPRRPRAACAST